MMIAKAQPLPLRRPVFSGHVAVEKAAAHISDQPVAAPPSYPPTTALASALKARNNIRVITPPAIRFKGIEKTETGEFLFILNSARQQYFNAVAREQRMGQPVIASTIIEEVDGRPIMMDLDTKLFNQGMISVEGPVTSFMAERITKQLMYLVSKKQGEGDNTPILMLINSPGGSVYDGLAIIDFMNLARNTEVDGKKLEIVGLVTGMAASMGSVIAASTDQCLMTPNAKFMLHEASYGNMGKSSGHYDELEEVSDMEERLFKVYENKTGYPWQEFKKRLLYKDVWLTAERSMLVGLADGVAKSFTDPALVEVGSNKPPRSIENLPPLKDVFPPRQDQ